MTLNKEETRARIFELESNINQLLTKAVTLTEAQKELLKSDFEELGRLKSLLEDGDK